MSFSALQRAENSSIVHHNAPVAHPVKVSVLFSEPKIPQLYSRPNRRAVETRFQCSSASRKFLNVDAGEVAVRVDVGFSALQRAENSSIVMSGWGAASQIVSVLFSEPKIPQLRRCAMQQRAHSRVSVLFSEPKIPQLWTLSDTASGRTSFSALQRAENSSIVLLLRQRGRAARFSALQRAENSSMKISAALQARRVQFQCSSASRKFLNTGTGRYNSCPGVFQCSSASRKFLNRYAIAIDVDTHRFQCSSASRKFLNSPKQQTAQRAD